tara:strand:- start:4379 stop:4567 length:189 start_codon:yes stop_codon:yes gene_type:complete
MPAPTIAFFSSDKEDKIESTNSFLCVGTLFIPVSIASCLNSSLVFFPKSPKLGNLSNSMESK